MDKMSHVGLSYYIIVELCAEKLHKSKDEIVTEADCLFRFSQRIVRQSCRISQTNLGLLLDICQTNGLLSWKLVGNEIEIYMPILLDLLEKNLKKRTLRSLHADSSTPLDIEQDIDKEVDKDIDTSVSKKNSKSFKNEIEHIYAEIYPLKKGKTKGVEKLAKEIKSDEDLENLKLAIANYSKTINDPKYIKHFSTFASEWKDWIDVNAGKATIQVSKQASSAQAIMDHNKSQYERVMKGEL